MKEYSLSCFVQWQKFYLIDLYISSELNLIFFESSLHVYGSGVLQTQKLRSFMLRSRSYKRFCLLVCGVMRKVQ